MARSQANLNRRANEAAINASLQNMTAMFKSVSEIKSEADARMAAVHEDVRFIALLTLYCTVEIYDGQPRIVLDGGFTQPSEACR